jgi:rhomboid protease GluP
MPMFLHIGLLHLLINSYALLILGLLLEGVYGFGRFVFIYVAAGIGSSLLSMTFSGKISAGASGAILGIAGAMLVTGYLHREAVPPRWGRIFGAGIIPGIVLTLLFGLVLRQWIDNWGHLGGLGTGVLLALVVPPPKREAEGGESLDQSLAAAVIPVAVVILAMVAAAQNYPASRQTLRLLLEGERLRSAGQIDQAVAKFREAARLAPHDERPHEGLGVIYLEQKRTLDAIQEYEQALRLNPGSPRAQLGLGVALERQGELVKARRLFEAVLGRNPGTAEGNELLADLCLEQKLYPEAVRHYQDALRLSPDMAVAHNNLAWLLATSEDPHFRDPKQALEHAHRAVELSKWKEATFIDTLAEALYANGNFQEAVRVQTKALVLDPQNREYQDHMARYRKAAGV